MSNYKDKAGVVALVVAILAIGISFFGGDTKTTETVREVELAGSSSFDVFEFQNGEGTVSDYYLDQITMTLGNATDTAWIQNLSGGTVYLRDPLLLSGNTASSTYRLRIIATTTPFVPNSFDYVDFTQSGTTLVEAQIATSTTGTTTTGIITATSGNGGVGSIAVLNKQYVLLYMQAVADVSCAPAIACETATSTNRGITPSAVFEVYATSTPIFRRN